MTLQQISVLTTKPFVGGMYSDIARDVEVCSFSVHILRLNDPERFSALRVDTHSSLHSMAKGADLELPWS